MRMRGEGRPLNGDIWRRGLLRVSPFVPQPRGPEGSKTPICKHTSVRSTLGFRRASGTTSVTPTRASSTGYGASELTALSVQSDERHATPIARKFERRSPGR